MTYLQTKAILAKCEAKANALGEAMAAQGKRLIDITYALEAKADEVAASGHANAKIGAQALRNVAAGFAEMQFGLDESRAA